MGRLAKWVDILVENEIRPRRPIILQARALDDSELEVDVKNTKKHEEDGASDLTFLRRFRNSARKNLTVRLLIFYTSDSIANGGTRRATSHC